MLGIILGGGAGSRLYPLTKKRAKPAVPLGANYRLIDIPVSNCINSGVCVCVCKVGIGRRLGCTNSGWRGLARRAPV